MTSLTICTHAFRYPRVLCFQLSSLVLHQPPPGFELAIVTADDDEPVQQVVDFFAGKFKFPFHDLRLPRNEACRRAIGRNRVAKLSQPTDWCWMIDADYVFGPGSLASLCQTLSELPPAVMMAFPGQVLGNRDQNGRHSKGANQVTSPDHEAGDSEIARCTPPQLIEIRPELYGPMGVPYAMGGVQIVRREYLQANGYLDGHPKHQRPVTDGEWPKERTPEDKAFRQQFKPDQIAKIEVPNVYRIRHSGHGGLNGVVNL